MIESRAVAGRTGNRGHPYYAVSNFRFYIIFIAALLLIFQVWNQRRNSGIDEWLWMLLVAAIFVGVWLGSKKVRPGQWRHTRKVGFALLAVGLVGAASMICVAAMG
ncbi:MAG: hypothetical protein OXI33_03585 [Chloroflexota bacterium]|nr:hypothetical protein [Chloroflexota bacterium]